MTLTTVSVISGSSLTERPQRALSPGRTASGIPVIAREPGLPANSQRAELTHPHRELISLPEGFQLDTPLTSGSKQTYTVLLLVSDASFDHATLRSTLASYPDIASVDFFNGVDSIPRVYHLLPYDAVITWANNAMLDMVATGDTLAAYVDLGGAVVCASWCWYLNGNHLEGEIMSATYNPFTGLGPNYYADAGLGWHDAGHPIMAGVGSVTDRYRDSLMINPGADSVAKWDDGEWFIATKGKVVGINGNPGDYGAYTGDMVLLFHNAVVWTQGVAEYAIFQDTDPWGSTSNPDILSAHGILFDVHGSADMGVVNLSQYRKVIISSAQANAFYVTLSANRAWFESYIDNGGVLEFHGATYTTESWAGLTMPTGFTCASQTTTDAISIQHAGHPLVLIPNIITDAELDGWNFSAHSYLMDLLPGYDEVLHHDDANEPSLIVQRYGAGWVIATMNTLEWAHANGYSAILENALLWFPGAEYAIFQEWDPWGHSSNQEILDANGIMWDMFGPWHMAHADLSMYTKVVISSQQDTFFYDSIAAHRTRFETYMANGGVLEFHGATYGFWDWSGLPMPTGFTSAFGTSNSVSIQAPGHPILTTPHVIGDIELDDWNYSTHGDLVSLVPGHTEILRNDSTGAPTLAVLDWGAGWLIATMNTLEFGYGNGRSPLLENVLLYMPTVGIEEVPSVSDISVIALHQNRPNPFEGETSIGYHIPSSGHISLKLYDKAGRLVRTLVDGVERLGPARVAWDGRDEAGKKVAAGVYFYSLETEDSRLSKQLILLR